LSKIIEAIKTNASYGILVLLLQARRLSLVALVFASFYLVPVVSRIVSHVVDCSSYSLEDTYITYLDGWLAWSGTYIGNQLHQSQRSGKTSPVLLVDK
jgi:EamA domain-containing membrane protein RarD